MRLSGWAAFDPSALLFGDEAEVGADRAMNELLERVALVAKALKDRGEAPCAVVGKGCEHLLLGAVVVIEGARREARAANDVAHGCGLVAQLTKYLPCGVEDRLPIGDFGLLAFADGGEISDLGHATLLGQTQK
jgi:hypothetical protein